ncbi:MAG TPA: FAD-binding oxidoreductase [Anaerolineales bacterium]|nr:FAD-binding oxidoreductase [Anaerolineales bacterium]
MTTNIYDAIIIGAGIAGTSLAFHLCQRGWRPVVLERRFVGAGATGRSSGLVRMHYDLEAESRLAWTSFDYFYNWRERVGGECGFTRTGFLQIVAPGYRDQLRANVAMHQRIGIPTLLVTPDDVKRLAPGFFTDDIELAAYEPESGYADPVSTAQSFLAAARARGAGLVQDCRVTKIKTSGGRVSGVETDRGEFHAPVVVNAAGAWAAEIGRMAGVEIPLDTWTHEVAYVRRPPSIRRHPTVIDLSLSMYFRPETGGLTLVALEDGNRFGEPPDADSEHVTPGFVERAVERLCRRIPDMEAGSLKSTHVGRDGITPDQRAILDQAGPEGFYLACGFSGTGFKLGPAVGACLSELIVDGRAVTVDISPFTLRRFEAGRLLTSEHPYDKLWR